MAVWLFRRSRARKDAERLLGAVILISRQPQFFGEGRARDTLEGRFEVMALHAALALIRMGREEETLAPLAQEFTDLLFHHLDGGLREAAVGDLAVPRRMRRIAGQFYARLDAYAKAMAAGDAAALDAALARHVLNAEDAPFAHALGRYVRQTAALQADAAIETLFRFDGWAPAPV